MKSIKFEDKFVPVLLSGKKDTTWRIDDEKGISAGDEIALCRKDGKEFARAKVLWVREKTYGTLTEEDKCGADVFASEKEMYEAFSQHYGFPVTPSTKVKVIKFRLL